MAKEEKNKPEKEDQLRVTSMQPGFRRAGRQWHGVTAVPVDDFTEDQIAALMAEPKLIVERI